MRYKVRPVRSWSAPGVFLLVSWAQEASDYQFPGSLPLDVRALPPIMKAEPSHPTEELILVASCFRLEQRWTGTSKSPVHPRRSCASTTNLLSILNSIIQVIQHLSSREPSPRTRRLWPSSQLRHTFRMRVICNYKGEGDILDLHIWKNRYSSQSCDVALCVYLI